MKIKILAQENENVDFDKVGKTVFKILKQKENLYCDLTFCDEEQIKELNKTYRNVDSVTDVLSFPSLNGICGKVVTKKEFPVDYDYDEKAIFIGSVAICLKRASEQAEEYGHSLKRELTFLTVHSLLHLMGYDHILEEDRIVMRKLENEIMEKLKIGEEQ